MWYDVEGLRSGARGAINAADQAAVAQSKLASIPLAEPAAFGDVEGAAAVAAALESARDAHSKAIAVFTSNSRTAAQRAVLAADLGAEFAAVSERVAFAAAAVTQAAVSPAGSLNPVTRGM